MTALTQIAITARKSLRYTLYFIIFLTVGRILWGVAITLYLQIFPPGPPPASVKYGRLPQIPFPADSAKLELTYTAETANGGLPTGFPIQSKVYFMPKVNPNLLSLDTAKSKAKQMGFNDPAPISESDTLYRFTHPSLPLTLKINIVTNAFSISYDLVADRTPVEARPPGAEIAADEFRDLLEGAENLPDDLTGPMFPEYLKLDSGRLVKVIALSEADVTKVNLFRKDYDKLPSMTAKPGEGNVWGIISGATQRDQKVIASEYHYFPVDETQFSTYPIITPEQAFNNLTNGHGFIASAGRYKDGDAVTIRKIYLAYFDPSVPSDFYQPIYVFDSADNDPANSFVAYFQAVDPAYYSE